jgi:hypothetical protein
MRKLFGVILLLLGGPAMHASTIFNDDYSGPITFCPAVGACTQLTQNGLAFTGAGQSITLSASFQATQLSIAESYTLVPPGGYFTGPSFFATATTSLMVTITGGSGQGIAKVTDTLGNGCDGTRGLLLLFCFAPVGQIISGQTFTFGTPFAVSFTQKIGLSILPGTPIQDQPFSLVGGGAPTFSGPYGSSLTATETRLSPPLQSERSPHQRQRRQPTQ